MKAARRETLHEDLGELPLTWGNYDQMHQLYQAYEGLVAGLIAAARTDGGDVDQAHRDRLVILDGLDGLESHFVGIGLDGATAARKWLQAASALATAGELTD